MSRGCDCGRECSCPPTVLRYRYKEQWFSLPVSEVAYIHACDKYLDVYHVNPDTGYLHERPIVVDTSLEKLCTTYPWLIRTHRAWAVAEKRMSHMKSTHEGAYRAIALAFESADGLAIQTVSVPVSRSLSKKVKAHLEGLNDVSATEARS